MITMTESDKNSGVDAEALLKFKANQVTLNHEVKEVIVKMLEGMADHEERLRKLEGRE